MRCIRYMRLALGRSAIHMKTYIIMIYLIAETSFMSCLLSNACLIRVASSFGSGGLGRLSGSA